MSCPVLCQVLLLLYIANWLVHVLWRRGSDPDNSAIPYLTAVGDLLGTVLLALALFVLSVISPVKVFHCTTVDISHKSSICFLYVNEVVQLRWTCGQ